MIHIYPMAFGFYHDPGLANLDVEPEVGRVVDLLSSFGAELVPWSAPAPSRGADAVQERLHQWHPAQPTEWDSSTDEPGSGANAVRSPRGSVLYWVGHGWSDGRRHALAHARSPVVVGSAGVQPEQLAHAIAARQARRADDDDGSGWVIVIIDTCKSVQIVDALIQALIDFKSPPRVLLVGVSPEGATSLGRFNDALRIVLLDTFRTEREIHLSDFATQLERVLGQGTVYPRALGFASLVRSRPPVAGWMFAPMDTVRHLEEVLNSLSADERWHFLSKARGAEHGELSWFFQGRRDEMGALVDWLEGTESGLLVVTGRAGSGKSALLGNLFTHSVPELRAALTRRGLLASGAEARVPPSEVFDAVIHLSGLDLRQITSRISSALDMGRVPSVDDPSAGIANDIDWLVSGLGEAAAASPRQFTLLVDALDEAVSPLDTARALLVRLASIAGVRVIVGTRPSVSESPDSPTADEDLLHALAPAGSDPAATRMLRLASEPEAIVRYVAARLRNARDHGEDEAASDTLAQVGDDGILAAARGVAGRGLEFLFARLAVYEILEDPATIRPQRSLAFRRLLAGDHQDLFGQAMERLARIDDRYPFLLQALSLARGRGLPEANGVWAAVAEALIAAATGDVAQTSGEEWSSVIHDVLSHAAPYIGADNLHPLNSDDEHSRRPGTVYRLAHREFVEYFTRGRGPVPPEVGVSAAADALLSLGVAMSDDYRALGQYLANHLSGHVADADRWSDLESATAVLDALDPDAVAADAIRSLFGRRDMPAQIAGVVGARDLLMDAALTDRRGIRQLASTVYGGAHMVGEERSTESQPAWGVLAAQIGEEPLHLRLTGHSSVVNKVCAVPLPDGRTVIASASDDGTVRLWDPLTLTPVGAPLLGHKGMVEDVVSFLTTSGEPRLATGGSDGTIRFWNPVSGQQILPPLEGHEGPVWEVTVIREPAGSGVGSPSPRVASAGADGSVRLWDGESGAPLGEPYRGHEGAAWTLTSVLVPTESGSPESLWIVSGGIDGRIHLWNPLTAESSRISATEGGPVRGLCPLHMDMDESAQGGDLVASAGSDGVIRVWNPASGDLVGTLHGHIGAVRHLANLPTPADSGPVRSAALSSLIVSAGSDGTVRAWDAGDMTPVGPPLTGHTGTVFGACGFTVAARPDQDRTVWIASAGGDATVRVWHVMQREASVGQGLQTDDPIYSLTVVDEDTREAGLKPAVITGSASGAVTVWDPGCGRVLVELRDVMAGPVHALCPLPREQGTLPSFAAGAEDGAIHFWSSDGHHHRTITAAHDAQVHGLTVVNAPSEADPARQRVLLVSAGGDGLLKVWDLGRPNSEPLTIEAHQGPAMSVSAVPAPGGGSLVASGGADGLVRVWDAVDGRSVMPPGRGHVGTVNSVSTIPAPARSSTEAQDTWLVSCGSDRTVRLWDVASGEEVLEPLQGHTGPVFAADWFTEPFGENRLATIGGDGTVRLWDLARTDQEPRRILAHVGEVHAVRTLAGGTSGVGTPLLVTAGDDSVVRLFDPTRAEPVGDPLSPRAVVSLHSDAEMLDSRAEYVVRADGSAAVWSPKAARLTRIPALLNVAHLASLSGDVGQQPGTAGPLEPVLAIVSTNGTILFQRRGGEEISAPKRITDRAPTSILSWPGEPARLLFGLATGEVGMWEPAQEHPLVRAHTGPVTSLARIEHVGASGVLVSAGDDGKLRMWDPTTLAPMSEPLQAHPSRIWSLAVANTSGRLLTSGSDGSVRIWRLEHDAFQQIGMLTGHSGEVHPLATFSLPDGRDAVLTGGHDGTIKEWSIDAEECLTTMFLGMPIHALGAVTDAADGSTHRFVTVGTSRGVISVTFFSGDQPMDDVPVRSDAS